MNAVNSRFDHDKLKDDKNKVEDADEKEEGEISLEDVSSSEEGQVKPGYARNQCPNCLSTQHCATWCTAAVKHHYGRGQGRDAVHGKENHHHIRESGSIGMKHSTSTLQERNDDFVSISSDSDLDMEIVSLTDSLAHAKARLKKRKKRERNPPMYAMEDLVSSSSMNVRDCVSGMKRDNIIGKSSLPRHYRDLSPGHRSSRSRLDPRSPSRRHRSPVRTRSSFKKSRSPFKKSRSPIMHGRSPAKSNSRKASRMDTSQSSHEHMDGHGNVNELLKKVRQLDTLGTKSIEEILHKNKEYASSLKEKLINMMKRISDNNANVPNYSNESSTAHEKQTNNDDEDDLALLRQKALATKQKKASRKIEPSKNEAKPEPVKKATTSLEDDQDGEDLKLRMIALHSAVLKKHQNRVQKGIKYGKNKKSNSARSESPFTQSFLDSIPIPEEQLISFASPPRTPHSMNENNHTEDMELDTDVEREKEKLPYSPTDKITVDISMDTELLGIQSSDVSFIGHNDANSPAFSSASIPSDHKSLQSKIEQTRSFLPHVPQYYGGAQGSSYEPSNRGAAYSPTDPILTPSPNFAYAKRQTSNVPVPCYPVPCSTFSNAQPAPVPNPMEVNSGQETPYSPSNVLQSLPQTPLSVATSNNSSPMSHRSSYASNAYRNATHYNRTVDNAHVEIPKEVSTTPGGDDKSDTLSMEPAVGSATTSIMDSISPGYSITIEDLPEIDSPSSDSQKYANAKTTNNIPRTGSQNLNEIVSEPLYMQGIPDITKDANKIPTLKSRMFVPAPILKSNKQLQQPMPARKHEVHPEPTFKSAEMQPVAITEETNPRTNTVFKPMKLISHTQKPASVLATPVAFHDSVQDDSTEEAQQGESSKEENKNDNTTQRENDLNTSGDVSAAKRKKSVKMAQKRKNNITQSNSNETEAWLNEDDRESTSEQNDTKKSRDRNQSQNVVRKNNPLVTEALIHTEETGARKGEDKAANDTANNTQIENLADKIRNQNDNTENINLKEDTTKSASTVSPDAKAAESRRQSLEEDEEQLRAILLASLPKRPKIADANNSDKTTTSANAATSADKIAVNRNISKPASPATGVGQNNVTISQPSNVCSSENDKVQTSTGTRDTENMENGSIESGASLASRKRSVPAPKGPQKKVVKKISIPASTKVVNNAKKYQNAIMQKRQNSQKGETVYNNQKLLENKAQVNENKWSTETKAPQLSDTQRIVINLQSDTESESESEQRKNNVDQPVTSGTTAAMSKQPPILNPGTFEKNLDQFLRDVRKKQEYVAAARAVHSPQSGKKDATPTPVEKSNPTNLHTPLAVRHLPVSQQEEYRRLKQQIIEREKLRLRRTIENSTMLKNKAVTIPSKTILPDHTNKQPCIAKVPQNSEAKIQPSVTRQPNNEINSKFSESMIITVGNVRKVQSVPATSVNPAKQARPPQLNPMKKLVTNANVRTPNEHMIFSNNMRKIGKGTTPTATIRPTVESTPCSAENGLKIKPVKAELTDLSKDEVNREYLQAQAKQRVDARKPTARATSNTSVVSKSNNSSGNKSLVKDFSEEDISQFVETVEKEIIRNDEQGGDTSPVDSDASTVILPRNRQESVDSSQSTVLLSQRYEETQGSQVSITDSNDNDNNLSLKSNSSLDSKMSIEENWEIIRKDVKVELNALNSLSPEEQERHLTDTEQKLVMKRYNILDELAEMSGNLRQWYMERDLQTNLVAEVKKLREQLRLAEESLQVQRNRINTIGPEVIAAHEKINAGRQECFKLSQVCSVLGTRVIGKEYKVPEAGAQLLENRLKEVANHTRQLSRKKVPSIDIPEITIPSPNKIWPETTYPDIESVEGPVLSESTNESTSIKQEKECSTEATTEVEAPPEVEFKESVEEKTDDNVIETEEECTTSNMVCSEPIAERSIASEDDTILEAHPEECSTPILPRNNGNVPSKVPKITEIDLTPESPEGANVHTDNEAQSKKRITPYISILTHFKVPRNANTNGILCPYELMGTCSDADCQYLHYPGNQAN